MALTQLKNRYIFWKVQIMDNKTNAKKLSKLNWGQKIKAQYIIFYIIYTNINTN